MVPEIYANRQANIPTHLSSLYSKYPASVVPMVFVDRDISHVLCHLGGPRHRNVHAVISQHSLRLLQRIPERLSVCNGQMNNF